jgi:hypothetical protein
MFVIFGIAAMLAFLYVRPHEIYESMRWMTFPLMLGVVVLGYVLDVASGVTRPPRITLLLGVGLAFFGWAMLSVAISAPDMLGESIPYFVAPAALFLAMALGVQTLRAFDTVAKVLLAITMLIVFVALEQGFSPRVCIANNGASHVVPLEDSEGKVHQCQSRSDCVDADLGVDEFLCERIGLMGTYSDGGRVRYMGIFQDPNELACATSISLPFVFMWFDDDRGRGRGRRLLRRLAPVPVLIASMLCNVMTQSRSGQISLVATMGVYFLRRFGMRGAVVGAVLAIPVLLFGGRSDESSTQERLECWAEALSMWREHPVIGIGAKQFGNHYYLTAHNSALLALSEMGPLGFLLWTVALYIAFKTTLQVQRDFANRPEAADVRSAAFATLAGMVGMVASALFLSLTYHLVFWLEVGLAAAIQTMIWRHDPQWRLRWRWRDLMLIIGLDLGTVVSIAIYLRLKGI